MPVILLSCVIPRLKASINIAKSNDLIGQPCLVPVVPSVPSKAKFLLCIHLFMKNKPL